jgi:hypothetical protein
VSLNPDDYFGDLKAPAPAAPAARPRYAPAPTTEEGAAARLADVESAEEEIRAWAESKRQKKGGGAPAPAAPAAPAAPEPRQPAAKQAAVNPDDYFEPLPAPKPPKPTLGQRVKQGLSDLIPRQDLPQASTEGLGQTSDEMMPAEVRSDPTAGQLLERPRTGATPEADLVEMSKSPDRRAAEAREAAARNRPPQEAKPLELTNRITSDLRAGTQNPALRGAIAGGAGLGKIGTGAVRLASDIFGAEALADFAKGAEGRAGAVERGATQDLKGNEKLVADIFQSIVNSSPSLAMGIVGGPAMSTLFAQSTLQEYGAGRDAGFGVGESLSRAGIMGAAEALGERFGFSQQIKLLKGAVKGMPSNEVARVFGELLMREIPGEQLTTAIQVLADKIGPAALNPNATLADYLEAAGHTLKVTIGQTMLMGGGPAALTTTRNEMRRLDDAGQRAPVSLAERQRIDGEFRLRDYEEFIAPKRDADVPPIEARTAALARFDEMAAAFGFNPKAVARAKEAAATMPSADVPGFLADLVDVLQQRGQVQRPIDAQGLRTLRQTLDSAEAETGAPQESAPANEGATDGNQEGQPEEGQQAQEGLLTPAGGDFTGLDETLDQAAHQAATSPLNDRPEPTDAQKAAGNYAKGHVRISGMDVSIENPKGSMRRSKADAPEKWEVQMPAHYGYIRGTTGADGDHVDLFVGDKGDNGAFWVINQTTPDGKAFDEHKVITGVDSAAEAIDLYKRSFADDFGAKVLGSVSQRMDAAQLKALLPDMSKANALHTPKALDDLQQPDVAVPAPAPAAGIAAGGDQPGGSGRTVGPGADGAGTGGVSAAAPGAGVAADAPAAGPATAADPALTDIAALKRQWQAAVARGDTAEAARINDQIVAAKAAASEPAPPPPPAPPPAPPAEPPSRRVIGKYGRTPKAAVEIELRGNDDGTLTPFSGRYAMVDFESGEPIVLPADVTDAQAAKAIRDAGAVGRNDKF